MASLLSQVIWFLLLQFPLFSYAQNVTVDFSLSTLSNTPYLTSDSGEFSFGFLPVPGRADYFLLAIWFAKVPIENIVWTAYEGKQVKKGSQVQLKSNGLSLTSSNGTIIWSTQGPLNNRQVASAALLNSGNFVLFASSDSTTLWESFQHPTDTLLPTQILDRNGKLISRLTKENYTPGRFQLILQEDSNLVLCQIARPTEDVYKAYHNMGNGSQLVFNQTGYLFLSQIDGDQLSFTKGVPASTMDFYHRVTLDVDGVLRQYTYPKSTTSNVPQTWSFAWSEPQNICKVPFDEFGSGVCGFNSYCSLKDQVATCECPPGYILSDPNNKFGGCIQDFILQSCGGEKLRIGVEYRMEPLPSTDWPFCDYEHFKNVGEDWCSKTCLDDCMCAVSVFREGECWLKKFPLSRGKLDPGSKGKALIKVGNTSSLELLPPVFGVNNNGRDKWSAPASALLGSSVLNFLLLLFFPLVIYFLYQKKKFKTMSDTSIFGVNLRPFTYKELEEATNGFDEELGRGACSTVYKGNLKTVSGNFVAVKKLEKVVRDADKEFISEISAIILTNHKNLVRLLGFCDEGTNRLLVYEYMRNGSLADFLFGSSRPDWSLRINIAFGVAGGLAYLHEDCSTQIIHCDVKPQNVLLDDLFIAKISDFGLAKLLGSDQTRTNTGIRGTRGYVALEWFKNMAITAKVDVYSFGIMLLEIISCRRNAEVKLGSEEIDVLSDWAYQCCVDRTFHLLVGKEEAAKGDTRLERFVMVAIWCIQEDPSLRPSMKKVSQMLEGAVEVSMPPDPSSFVASFVN